MKGWLKFNEINDAKSDAHLKTGHIFEKKRKNKIRKVK